MKCSVLHHGLLLSVFNLFVIAILIEANNNGEEDLDEWSELNEETVKGLEDKVDAVQQMVDFDREDPCSHFIKRELDRIRGLCNRPPIETITFSHVTQQVVSGTEYTVDAVIDGSVKKSIKFMRRNSGDRRPTHGPRSSIKKRVYLRDEYEIISIEPHPCPKHSFTQFEQVRPRDRFRATGLILDEESDKDETRGPPPERLTPSQKSSIPSSYDVRQHLPPSAAASQPQDQGSCGSCYAFTAATSFAYRLHLQSGGRYDTLPSVAVGMKCAFGEKACAGGHMKQVWKAMRDHDIPGS